MAISIEARGQSPAAALRERPARAVLAAAGFREPDSVTYSYCSRAGKDAERVEGAQVEAELAKGRAA